MVVEADHELNVKNARILLSSNNIIYLITVVIVGLSIRTGGQGANIDSETEDRQDRGGGNRGGGSQDAGVELHSPNVNPMGVAGGAGGLATCPTEAQAREGRQSEEPEAPGGVEGTTTREGRSITREVSDFWKGGDADG